MCSQLDCLHVQLPDTLIFPQALPPLQLCTTLLDLRGDQEGRVHLRNSPRLTLISSHCFELPMSTRSFFFNVENTVPQKCRVWIKPNKGQLTERQTKQACASRATAPIVICQSEEANYAVGWLQHDCGCRCLPIYYEEDYGAHIILSEAQGKSEGIKTVCRWFANAWSLPNNATDE